MRIQNHKPFAICHMPFAKQRGQSLAEILIAIGIFVIAVGATLAFIRSQIVHRDLAQSTLRALGRAEEGLEAARTIRDRDWTELAVGLHGLSLSSDTWTFQGTSDTSLGITRVVTVTDRVPNERLVTSTVTWSPTTGRSRVLTLTSILSNWRNISAPLLSGNWQDPQSLGSVDIGPGNAATGLAVRSRIVYLTAKASDRKKNDFYIINATDGQNPFIVGRIDTGRGLNAVAVSGSYAYVAQDATSNQLQIINVANPALPILVKSFSVAGNGTGISVGITGTTVLLGTPPTTNPELFLVDVSDPVNPRIVGSYEVGAGVNDIFISGSYAFLATTHDDRELMILDITDPGTPLRIGAVNLTGEDDARGIYVNSQDSWAHVVRENDGSHPTHSELAVIDVMDPTVPTILGSFKFSEDINTVVAADNLSFIGTSFASEEFQIYEVSDPSAITYWSGLNFPQIANDMALEDNMIYVAVRSNDALRIITSADQ